MPTSPPLRSGGRAPGQHSREIRECCAQGTAVSVQENVLRDVKVLGLESANGRRYTHEACQLAIPLYEGAKVNIDHPTTDPDAVRTLNDRFGKLEGVRIAPDGLYANLRYNPAHALAETVTWWAANSPDCLGLSHNALGHGRLDGDVFVVEKILAVRAVDLVADPATTRGLFESHGKRRDKVLIKLKNLAESLSAPRKARLLKLVEDGILPPEMEMVGGDGEPDHDEALRGGFEQGCLALIKQALAGDLDAKEALRKLKSLLKAHGEISGSGGGESEPDDELEADGETDEDGEEDKDMDESLKKTPAVRKLLQRLDRLEAERAVEAKQALAREVCEQARLPKELVTPVFLEQLASAPNRKAMEALVADRKTIAGARVQRPHSVPSGVSYTTPTTEGRSPMSDAEFLRVLKGGR